MRFGDGKVGTVWRFGWLITFIGCVVAGVSAENYNEWLMYFGFFLVFGGLLIRFYWYILRWFAWLFKRERGE